MLHVPNENPDGIKGKKNLIHGRTLNLLPFFLIIKNITYVHLVKTVGLHSCIKSAIIIYENKTWQTQTQSYSNDNNFSWHFYKQVNSYSERK